MHALDQPAVRHQMDQRNIPDPSIVNSLLSALDQHPHAVLAVIFLAVIAVAWKHAGKNSD